MKSKFSDTAAFPLTTLNEIQHRCWIRCFPLYADRHSHRNSLGRLSLGDGAFVRSTRVRVALGEQIVGRLTGESYGGKYMEVKNVRKWSREFFFFWPRRGAKRKTVSRNQRNVWERSASLLVVNVIAAQKKKKPVGSTFSAVRFGQSTMNWAVRFGV